MAEGFLLGPGLLARTRRAVETVEGMPIGSGFRESPLLLEGESPVASKVFRICTFTGAWAIGATKTVEFKYQTSTPNTASVTNLFFPWPGADGTTDCAIAREGTAWHLIDVPMQTATAVFVSATMSQSVLTGISLQGSVDPNSFSCDVTINATVTTASIAIASITHTAHYLTFSR